MRTSSDCQTQRFSFPKLMIMMATQKAFAPRKLQLCDMILCTDPERPFGDPTLCLFVATPDTRATPIEQRGAVAIPNVVFSGIPLRG